MHYKIGLFNKYTNTNSNIYIKPITLYCSGTLLTSDWSLEKLGKLQNQALRIVTGGVQSTSIEAMCKITNIHPITLKKEEQSMILYKKLLRCSKSTWRHRVIPVNRDKKTLTFHKKNEQECYKHK